MNSNKLQNSWWPEKYRPQTIDELVGNEDFIAKVKNWIETQEVPNLVLYSEKSGTGKTSACKVIAKLLDADVKYINASDENSIDTVRDVIKTFASTSGFSKWKIIILDEFSGFTKQAQSAILSIIESSSAHTRFFLTGNYIDKFLPAVISRCHPFRIQSPPAAKIFENISRILNIENVKFEAADLVNVIKRYYPDQRAMIQYCQINSYTGSLVYNTNDIITNDYCEKVLEELKAVSRPADTIFKNIRQIIADAKVRDFDDLFRYLFDNINEFAGQGSQANIILTLADYQFKAAQVIDKEIMVSAMIIQILTELK